MANRMVWPRRTIVRGEFSVVTLYGDRKTRRHLNKTNSCRSKVPSVEKFASLIAADSTQAVRGFAAV